MSSEKPKHKIIRTVKEGDLIRTDERTWQTKNYMIYNSERLGFLCDCRAFMFNDKVPCKHILRVKEEFNV